ncbi:SRPBCC family protein [Flavobacterium crassostreae]|nr:SRPBCC family protein [Flavobacterium crassostreae]
MRILKYLFLLALLSLVALSIFIATQKGDFEVERSKVINSPKEAVFSYVNDYKNWVDFGSWIKKDPEIKNVFPENTIGKGAFYTWESKDGDGRIQTLYTKENDSIAQKMDFNGSPSLVYWTFKETPKGTKVTWRIKGNMNFAFKVYTALNGGVDRVIGSMYEKSLENLDQQLDYEINNYSVKVDGLAHQPMRYYIGQRFTSEIAKINKNFKIVIPKITSFCEQNGITTSGKPFIIYNSYDLQTQLANITICLPIQKEIFISEGSDLVSSKLGSFEAVKATLTGDHSHTKTAYNKALAYLNQNKLVQDAQVSHIEVYTTTSKENKAPSKWTTEVYIPLPIQEITVEPSYYAPTSSEQEAVPTTEAPVTKPTVTKPTATKPAVTNTGVPKTITTPSVAPKRIPKPTPKPAPKVVPKKESEKVVKPTTPKKEEPEVPMSADDEFEF